MQPWLGQLGGTSAGTLTRVNTASMLFVGAALWNGRSCEHQQRRLIFLALDVLRVKGCFWCDVAKVLHALNTGHFRLGLRRHSNKPLKIATERHGVGHGECQNRRQCVQERVREDTGHQTHHTCDEDHNRGEPLDADPNPLKESDNPHEGARQSTHVSAKSHAKKGGLKNSTSSMRTLSAIRPAINTLLLPSMRLCNCHVSICCRPKARIDDKPSTVSLNLFWIGDIDMASNRFSSRAAQR